MEYPQIDLYEFLTESELQQYYNAIKNELKITNAAQFKYAADEDLRFIGLSRPEIRRLRKFYEKHFPHSYLSKIKRLLQAPTTIVKREDGASAGAQAAVDSSSNASVSANKNGASSPSKVPNNKHIIPADSISVNKQLGTGEFGIVQQGVWTNGSERIQVAIKCLCRERMQSNPMEFLKEAAIMHSIEHENIVRLYGVVLATDSLMLVTELAHLRSLLECLKDSGLRVSFLTIPTLCEFALQICNGMRYLEQKRLIHRDLAARNILVFSKDKVKISDFGLSRALGVGKDYYKTNFNVNLKLPIAWCAPECINYLRFTNASDVWAYGVCLWEMFSYGFQPWAALTGLQILEAIDAPNYQRLEQPDCCPSEYYTLMMKCWQDDAAKRPKFSEIYEQLPDMKPEQLKAVVNWTEPKKDHLIYRQGDIISVLDRNTGTPYWKGVLSTGKTGYFNPSNTVAFLEGLPSSNRDSFSRVGDHRISKRKLRTEMISKPQNDFKHTGHVGIDGATFGDIAFLGSSQNYNHVPKQIVTPYKPSEDIEQTPLLLPPTPTSPDSLQTASGYFPEGSHATSMNPTFIPSTENTPKLISNNGQSSFDFATITSSTNPFVLDKLDEDQLAFGLQNNNYGGQDGKSINSRSSAGDASWRASLRQATDDLHEYHEISDDEIAGDKLDFGPSLLDEINSMFGSISGPSGNQPKSPDFEHVNSKNEFVEMTAKFGNKSGDTNGNKHSHGLLPTLSKKKTAGTVKPISVKDEKILNHAIDMANEISARSMVDLVSEHAPATHSPKRKFSFRFPHLSSSGDKSSGGAPTGTSGSGGAHTPTHGNASPFSKKKNFTEELQSIPDIQRFRSLSEIKNSTELRIPIFDKESSDFCFEKSREILSRPLTLDGAGSGGVGSSLNRTGEAKSINDNIMDIENTLKALNLDFMHTYTELDKSDSNETILNDQFPHMISSLDDGISSATGSLKSAVYSYSNGVQTMFDFNAATSHLDKHLQYMHNQAQLSAAVAHSEQMQQQQEQKQLIEDKRSSTPDTGFASRDTNISLSRRSSQKSSYSPQESYFPYKSEAVFNAGIKDELSGYERFGQTKPQLLSCASPIKSTLNVSNTSVYSPNQLKFEAGAASKSYRQRSTSFTENFNPISPVLSEPQQRIKHSALKAEQQAPYCKRPTHETTLPRRSASYKPRSIRARTLRRLSYNPMTLDSSSSSGEEEAASAGVSCKPNLARSECDIRARVSSLYRRRRPGLNRQVQSAGHDEREIVVSPRNIYGSNSSIKSAPHYNFGGGNRRSFHCRTTYEQFNYDERIYDFGGRGPGNNYGGAPAQQNVFQLQKPPNYMLNGAELPGSGSGSSSAASSAVNATYRTNCSNGGGGGASVLRPLSGTALHEFDVSRLTGKSPTSTNFVGSSPDELKQRQLSANSLQLLMANSGGKPQRPTEFHWPEKIHASAVKQHEQHWRQMQHQKQQVVGSSVFRGAIANSTTAVVAVAGGSSESTSSSSTESGDEFQFRREFAPHIPPSPAP
ncbi:activated Cdc42 kinase-like isoform X1 [Scaptodrosophila lebanonensis]|uniref:non-specific protein-tyrosine kinase n=1 Tax=Drosophila lebanonensis TaxID=7225 RepID=A0A6J2TBM5_DROLE|nr:activated Cdc42 kinase-like isoform X1 [Scaptodrosophila lebanonensis]